MTLSVLNVGEGIGCGSPVAVERGGYIGAWPFIPKEPTVRHLQLVPLLQKEALPLLTDINCPEPSGHTILV